MKTNRDSTSHVFWLGRFIFRLLPRHLWYALLQQRKWAIMKNPFMSDLPQESTKVIVSTCQNRLVIMYISTRQLTERDQSRLITTNPSLSHCVEATCFLKYFGWSKQTTYEIRINRKGLSQRVNWKGIVLTVPKVCGCVWCSWIDPLRAEKCTIRDTDSHCHILLVAWCYPPHWKVLLRN